MKKSYKGFMAWLVLFCVGVLAIILMDIKNIDLVGLVLGNYIFITLAILTGMIYKNEAIYWYTGISYQEACAVTSKQRKEYAYKHFIRFLMVCLGYFVYSIIAYFLSFSFRLNNAAKSPGASYTLFFNRVFLISRTSISALTDPALKKPYFLIVLSNADFSSTQVIIGFPAIKQSAVLLGSAA